MVRANYFRSYRDRTAVCLGFFLSGSLSTGGPFLGQVESFWKSVSPMVKPVIIDCVRNKNHACPPFPQERSWGEPAHLPELAPSPALALSWPASFSNTLFIPNLCFSAVTEVLPKCLPVGNAWFCPPAPEVPPPFASFSGLNWLV